MQVPRFASITAALAFVLLLLAPATPAQSPSAMASIDPAWSSWLGCWELRSQSVNRMDLETAPGQLVCLKPMQGGAGVEVLALEDGSLVKQDSFVADGVRRERAPAPPCRGWQQAVWSRDGERLYLRSELSCAEGPPRATSAVGLLSPTHAWVEIRLLRFGERTQVAVRRFLPARPAEAVSLGMQPAGSAPWGVATGLSVDDLIEASQQLEPEVVEALLLESGLPEMVDAAGLARLADAGVDGGIIDVAVALSFPERYAIDHGLVVERMKEQPSVVYHSSYASAWPWWGYHGYSNWWYWYPIHPAPPSLPGTPGLQPGRVVKGHGYTRARVVPAGQGSGGFGRAVVKSVGGKSGGGSHGSDSSGSGSSGSSGGSSASPGGYSSGGSTGRTAVPRPKGDGR